MPARLAREEGDPCAGATSLPAILSWRAGHQPDRLAYVFLADGESEEARLTYSELDRRARNLARTLLERGAAGDRALLLYPASLDFVVAFFGCLYAGLIAVSTLPPRRGRSLSALARVAGDSGATIALTTSGLASDLLPEWGSHPELADVEPLATDGLRSDRADTWDAPAVDPDALAFLQYTSGSTSAPRGVMVTHANVLYNCACMQAAFGLSADTVSVTWLPHFHDMGLIEGLLDPIYVGHPAVIIPPAQFVRSPIGWLRAISRYSATHGGGPNFAFDLCASKVSPADRDGLDLSSWRTAYSGAEPVRKETLDRFAEAFASCGFRARSLYPCYGLAEATLMVSGGLPDAPPVFERLDASELEQHRVERAGAGAAEGAKVYDAVGCGRAYLETVIRIVDPDTCRVLPADRVGEIWVGGPTVARGYWHQPDATRATFEARVSDTGEGPFLRTGDLGFLRAGELFITGRIKDLIIIRGANHYPQDLEWVAQHAHPALRPGFGVAFSVEAEGGERLVIAHEVERRYRSAGAAELGAVAAAVREAIAAQFELEVFDVVLMKVGGIPTTSSGKLQRRACRSDYLAGRLEVLGQGREGRLPAVELGESGAPIVSEDPRPLDRDELLAEPPRERRRSIESYLRRHLGLLLGIAPRRVDPRAALGSLGLDSLKGVQLVARMQNELGIELSNTLVWNHPTIVDVAEHLAASMGVELDREPSKSARPASARSPGKKVEDE